MFISARCVRSQDLRAVIRVIREIAVPEIAVPEIAVPEIAVPEIVVPEIVVPAVLTGSGAMMQIRATLSGSRLSYRHSIGPVVVPISNAYRRSDLLFTRESERCPCSAE
jgi:hypothetical protein